MQYSFSRLFGSNDIRSTENYQPFQTDAEAKAARDAKWRELKAQGVNCKRSKLGGQLREWWAFGVPCGDCCEVYYINVWDF
jgi:alanyl-tRNA synthetase